LIGRLLAVPASVRDDPAMSTYAFGRDKPERLAGIEATWDAKTIRHLEALGVRQGWQCLEVGAGGGSIAEWLADRVAPDGGVLAIDLDTQFLELIERPNLEARVHDLRHDDLASEAFDLVHGRLLLSHIHDSDALDRMLGALKPGGAILLEDFDYTRGAGMVPPLPVVDRAYEAVVDQVAIAGWDRAFGSRLLSVLTAAGVEDVGTEGTCFLVAGGSPGTAFERLSLVALREPMVARGAVTDAELDEAIALFEDPNQCVATPVMVAAWGRKPF
jgi:2-polyprenyl-3-methyl-5-hydroxy-6-metoxy-1,4-benzoquinol methylase